MGKPVVAPCSYIFMENIHVWFKGYSGVSRESDKNGRLIYMYMAVTRKEGWSVQINQTRYKALPHFSLLDLHIKSLNAQGSRSVNEMSVNPNHACTCILL